MKTTIDQSQCLQIVGQVCEKYRLAKTDDYNSDALPMIASKIGATEQNCQIFGLFYTDDIRLTKSLSVRLYYYDDSVLIEVWAFGRPDLAEQLTNEIYDELLKSYDSKCILRWYGDNIPESFM